MSKDIRIAGDLAIKDWEDLKGILNCSANDNWGKAFSFFRQRITTRYLNPIHQILNMNLKTGEGFAVVSLQCSLIETIESFYNGWIYDYPNYKKDGIVTKKPEDEKKELKNVDIFRNFFKNRTPFKEKKIDGESFFYHVRCALLHETQTKNDWIIRGEHYEKFYEILGDKKIIYRTNFQTALEAVIDDYEKDILNGAGKVELRKNFTAKFNHICDVS